MSKIAERRAIDAEVSLHSRIEALEDMLDALFDEVKKGKPGLQMPAKRAAIKTRIAAIKARVAGSG